MYKKLLLLLFFLILPVLQVFPQIKIVESVPVETVLTESNLARPYDEWLDMINNANRTIDIEVFYFANQPGEPLDDIINALISAGKRGVKIRIIVDKSFVEKNENSIEEIRGKKNISIRKFDIKSITGGVMHSKHFIVDGKEIFLGSQNFDWRALKHIHEMGIRVKDENLAKLFSNIFNMDWKLCAKNDNSTISKLKEKYSVKINRDNPLTINSAEFGKVKIFPTVSPESLAPDGYSDELEELLEIIDNAKSKLRIQVMTYSLKNDFYKIDRALRNAADRGVDVKIIFADWTIKKASIEDIKSLSQVKNIEIKFSNIPEYSLGYIPYSRVDHSKYLIADDEISRISTSNWEYGYFENTRNMSLIIYNNEINKLLEKVFYNSWNSSLTEKVDPSKEYQAVKRN